MKKKVLLLSISCGNGHIRAADALQNYINSNSTYLQATHIDIAQYLHPIAKYIHKTNYAWMKKYARHLWFFLYYLNNTKGFTAFLHATTQPHSTLSRKLQEIIKKENPDIVICTYYGAVYMIHNICADMNIPVYTVMTDYHAHHIYAYKHTSGIFVPSVQQKQQLRNCDVPNERIFATGIPIDESLLQQSNKQKIMSTYNIVPCDTVVVVNVHNYSKRTLAKLLRTLHSVQQRTYIFVGKKINIELLPHHSINIPWTNNMEDIYTMADVMISKSGGLTTTECIATHTPLIAYAPMPGHEVQNAKYIDAHGYGVYCKKTKDLPRLINTYTKKSKPSRHPKSLSAAKNILHILEKKYSK